MVQLLREENLGPGQYFPRIRCGKAVRTFRRKIGTSFLFFFCFVITRRRVPAGATCIKTISNPILVPPLHVSLSLPLHVRFHHLRPGLQSVSNVLSLLGLVGQTCQLSMAFANLDQMAMDSRDACQTNEAAYRLSNSKVILKACFVRTCEVS